PALFSAFAIIFGIILAIGPPITVIVLLAKNIFDQAQVIYICSWILTGTEIISGFTLVLVLGRESYWKKGKWIGPNTLYVVTVLTHVTLTLYATILISSWVLAHSLLWYHHLMV